MQATHCHLIFHVHKIPSLTSISLYFMITTGELLLMGAVSTDNSHPHSQHPSLCVQHQKEDGAVFTTLLPTLGIWAHFSPTWTQGGYHGLALPGFRTREFCSVCYFKAHLPILSSTAFWNGLGAQSHLIAWVLEHYQTRESERRSGEHISLCLILPVLFLSHIKTFFYLGDLMQCGI